MKRHLLYILILFSATSLKAQTFQKKITGASAGVNGRNAGDWFGTSVSVSGEFMVVGAMFHDYDSAGGDSLADAGAAFLYRKMPGEWKFIKKLTGASAGKNGRAAGDLFGEGVGIYGDVIVVGAPLNDFNSVGSDSLPNTGAIYIFHRNKGGKDNWGFVKKLTAEWESYSGRVPGDNLGSYLSISEDVIIVGVTYHAYDSVGQNKLKSAGATYVFHRNKGGKDNWGFVKKLTAGTVGFNGRKGGDAFGCAVSVSKDVVVVGAIFHDYDSAGVWPQESAGAAYVYHRNNGGNDNWGFVKKLTGGIVNTANFRQGDNFGVSVSVSDSTIIVGACRQDFDGEGMNNKTDAGAAFIYYRNKGGNDNWGFVRKVTQEPVSQGERVAGDFLGLTVFVSGDTAIVGSSEHAYDSVGGVKISGAGAAYLYFRNKGGADNWGFVKKLTGSSAGPNGKYQNDNFSQSLSISEDVIAVGAWKQEFDSAGTNLKNDAGALYIYSFKQQKNTSITELACNNYLSPMGKNYTNSGIYYDTLKSNDGTDSIITINLTVNKVKNTVTQQGIKLTANDSNATAYQWLDCANNYAIISGQENQTFTAVSNGSYAVEVALGNCIDTSSCINITGLTIIDVTKQNISLYPNPTKGQVTVIFSQPIERAEVKVLNITGQVIFEKKDLNGNTVTLDLTTVPSGIYFVEVSDKETTYRNRLVKF